MNTAHVKQQKFSCLTGATEYGRTVVELSTTPPFLIIFHIFQIQTFKVLGGIQQLRGPNFDHF